MNIRIKNTAEVTKTWGGKEFQPNEIYQVQTADYNGFLSDQRLFQDVANGVALIGDMDAFKTSVIDAWEYLEHDGATEVSTVGELQVTWAQMKQFYDDNATGTYLNYVDMGDYYYIWAAFRSQKMFIPKLLKTEATQFESTYKMKCNVNEAQEVRITTNRFGRRLHRRYISFTTASQGTFCNHNYLLQDQGDVTYKMLDENGQPTTVNADAETTMIDFEPSWCYEIASGAIYVPDTLAGSDDDYWEFHAVGVPDVPESMGGCIAFIQNPHLRWSKGNSLMVDSTLNPANMRHSSTYHTNKIRFIVHHPKGAQSDFQVVLGMFRCTSTSSSVCAQHSKGVR
jgi:hypothetical protein